MGFNTQRFREVVARSGHKIKYIAQAIGVSEWVLYGMHSEPNYNPTSDTIVKVCSFFNVSPNELLITSDNDDGQVQKAALISFHQIDNEIFEETSEKEIIRALYQRADVLALLVKQTADDIRVLQKSGESLTKLSELSEKLKDVREMIEYIERGGMI